MLGAGLASLLLAAAMPALSAKDEAAAFKAAGFTQRNGIWRTDCDRVSDAAGYVPVSVERIADFNRDGRPEAIITEGSLFCYGNTATGFRLVSKRPGGRWLLLHRSHGIPRILGSRANGWPEIEVGGAGFCFSVLRWNRGKFAIHRHQYEGKPCRP